MKINSIISVTTILIILTGCAKEETQIATPVGELKKEDTQILTPKNEVKKAPRIEVKENTYVANNIKYKDTSESSKVKIYDPNTKKVVSNEEEAKKIYETPGGKIFQKKGCTLCHKESEFRIGPSLRRLARGYKNKKNELVTYLQRKGQPIIYPDRSSIMKSQLVKLTIMSATEYNELSEFILNGGK